jgi:hypothetical protein
MLGHYILSARGPVIRTTTRTCNGLSPITHLADLYMEKMEREFMDKGKEKIKFWKRYVNDVFAMIQGNGDPGEILHQANNISLTVKWIRP